MAATTAITAAATITSGLTIVRVAAAAPLQTTRLYNNDVLHPRGMAATRAAMLQLPSEKAVMTPCVTLQL